jgi:hypothetical protein
MSITTQIDEAAKMLGAATAGLKVLQGMTNVGGDRAVEALAMVGAGLAAISNGFDGLSTADEVKARIESLVDGLSANDSDDDAKLAKRFESTTTD